MLEESFFDRLEVLSKLCLGLCLELFWISGTFLSWCLSFNLLIVGQFLGDFEVLFSSSFSFKNLLHDFLFFWGSVVQWLAELHYINGTLSITNGGHVLVYRDGSKRRITDLLTVTNFILSIIEVPDVKETVDSSQKEKTASSLGPATVGKIR